MGGLEGRGNRGGLGGGSWEEAGRKLLPTLLQHLPLLHMESLPPPPLTTDPPPSPPPPLC